MFNSGATQQATLELYNELKKLEKFLKEIETARNAYTNLTKKLTQKDKELTEKQMIKLLNMHRETKLVITKADRACTASIDRATTVEKKRKRENPVFLRPGRQVAAKTNKPDEVEEWILASVVKLHSERNLYEVEDEDPGDEHEPNPHRKHYSIPPSHIIPLPESFEKPKEYTKGSEVLAMFPNTTAFYTAIVVQPPKGRKPEYTLRFADDDDDSGDTPLRKVLSKYVVSKSDTLADDD